MLLFLLGLSASIGKLAALCVKKENEKCLVPRLHFGQCAQLINKNHALFHAKIEQKMQFLVCLFLTAEQCPQDFFHHNS